MSRRPRHSALFPYPTLFRSLDPGRSPAAARSRLALLPGAGAILERRPARAARADGRHRRGGRGRGRERSEEHTFELQSRGHLVCRLLLEKKKKTTPASQAAV